MYHINENQLKAFVDGEEIEGMTQDELERHLLQCQKCKVKEEELQAQKVEVQKRLEFFASPEKKWL
jgi:anti-sigma factor RsiW